MKPEDISTFNALNDSEAAILTVYGEARGESAEGKQAVCQVIANRAERWRKTVKQICFAPAQFSCFISGDPNYLKLLGIAKGFRAALTQNGVLQACSEAWKGDRSGVAAKVDSATFYRVTNYPNHWFDKQVASGKLIKTAQIGAHEFFKEV